MNAGDLVTKLLEGSDDDPMAARRMVDPDLTNYSQEGGEPLGAVQQTSVKLNRAMRNKITTKFNASGLGGTGRFQSKGAAISAINAALEATGSGLFLDAVPGDILLGDEGSRVLPLYSNMQNPTETARLLFSWYRRDPDGPHDNYEVVSYVT